MRDNDEELTDEEYDEEIRRKYAYTNDDAFVENMVIGSRKHRKEHRARQARLEFIRTLPTFEGDDVPHDGNRCLGCGRWFVEDGESYYGGPVWACPDKGCMGWHHEFNGPTDPPRRFESGS